MKYTGNRKFQATEEQMIIMFINYCKDYGSTNTGTYNKQDPTHFEKTKVQFLTYDEESYFTIPIDININNVTWVIDIVFSENGQELARGTWDTFDTCFINVSLDGEAFFDLLHKVFFYSEHESEQSKMEDPYGCLSDYE